MTSTPITWKWIKESFLPLVINDARRVGVDTGGWALRPCDGGRALVKHHPDQTVTTLRRFATPREADLVMQGMRFAWTRHELTDTPASTTTDPTGGERAAGRADSTGNGATA